MILNKGKDMEETEQLYEKYPGQLELHLASGERHNDDLVVAFLYRLMRDYTTPGVVEGIVQDILLHHGGDIAYTNGWLERYAEFIVERLREKDQDCAIPEG